jgi:capsular exopolysaccharide synthesis family protein
MNPSSQNDSGNQLDLKEVVSRYTRQWKWFVLSVIAFIALAFLYLRYTIPQYSAMAKIQVVEDKGAGTGIDLFQELELVTGGKSEVQDEIQIINSRSNFIEVVKELGLNTRIMVQGNILESELYSNPPIKLNLIAADSVIYNADYEFYLTLSSTTTFGFSDEAEQPVKVHAFGKNISTPVGDIVITPDLDHFDRYRNSRIKVVIRPVSVVAIELQNKISVFSASDPSNIVNIFLVDPIREKAKDVINSLVRIYNENAIEDKRIIADRTSNFIDERITDIYSSLSTVDQSAQELKTERGLTDIASEANINLNIGAANRQELANYETQLNIAASMQDLVQEQDDYEVLPSNIGLEDATIASTTERFNQLVLERKRLLKSSTERSPIIQNLDQEINGLKQSMMSSLNSTVNNLGMQVNTLSQQQSRINSRIYSSPRNERALRDITRQQQTTESLYLYLLQKREEAQIAVASSAPKSKVIDTAYSPSESPESPKPVLVLMVSMILGLLLPFSVIYGNDLLDNKVHNMHSLERITRDIPVLGEIPRSSLKENMLVVKDDRSVLAESLRILRTNLDFLIKTNKKGSKNNVVYVTSSVPGEGKTFVSSNLAMILSSTGKKVLLVGADIRNPKLYSFFVGDSVDKLRKPGRNKDAGLTEFLYDDQISLNDIINPMLVHSNTVDVIYSGRIPPNPAELLMSDRLKLLLREVSELYDYVIVDTAPLMVVSDTLLINDYADHIIYVTRAGVTEKKVIKYPLKLSAEGKIKGLAFVVNDVKETNLGYGGKYGYGYGKTQKKWWKF